MATFLSEATRDFDAPIGRVWAIVAAYGSEALWMPNVAKATLDGFGVGSTRSLYIQNGPDGGESWDNEPVRELLVAASGDDHSLRWQVFNDYIGNNESYSGVRLESISEERTRMTWYGETDLPDGPDRQNLGAFLEGMYRGCMEAIAKKVEA
ncbi:hypothetical protein NCS57_01192000 [Fusarium keratoplasticum]|uniref:Uncharacterized protein n=1 Tax=Fusarium keratoplasticum TaxID=1328300 RepID=A0ACC0QID9_9HYPO|nr:hypothetical protein NCS57_01192000 [Fusarium keratoplasticum]KAI8654466.1 hypothetical protein NCS57_01192000 [Fusarium keratoplasticum]